MLPNPYETNGLVFWTEPPLGPTGLCTTPCGGSDAHPRSDVAVHRQDCAETDHGTQNHLGNFPDDEDNQGPFSGRLQLGFYAVPAHGSIVPGAWAGTVFELIHLQP